MELEQGTPKTAHNEYKYIVGVKEGDNISIWGFMDEFIASQFINQIKQGMTASKIAYGKIPARLTDEEAAEALYQQLSKHNQKGGIQNGHRTTILSGKKQ